MGPYGQLAVLLAISACGQPPMVGEERAASLSVCAAGQAAKGVDVSAEVVDWQAFAAGGWDFAIAKASEGVTFVEPVFATNWKAMKAAGVVRGAYCFFHSSPDDPVVEADFFVDTINQAGGYEPGDFLALDLEVLDGNAPDVVARDALAWLERVKSVTGITPIIYTSPRVFDTLLGSPLGFSSYPLWDVTWNGGPPKCPNIPASWPGWAFWQYAGDSISAPGLPGSMNDGDVFNGSRDELAAFGLSLAGVATPDAGAVVADAGPMPHADGGAVVDAGHAAADSGVGGGGSGDLSSLGVTLTSGCSVGGEGDGGVLVGFVAAFLVGVFGRRMRVRRPARAPASGDGLRRAVPPAGDGLRRAVPPAGSGSGDRLELRRPAFVSPPKSETRTQTSVQRESSSDVVLDRAAWRAQKSA